MRSAIINAKRIVVKVGSSTLCYANGHLNLERIERLVRQLSDLANQGKEVILVSSGATGAGQLAAGHGQPQPGRTGCVDPAAHARRACWLGQPDPIGAARNAATGFVTVAPAIHSNHPRYRHLHQ